MTPGGGSPRGFLRVVWQVPGCDIVAGRRVAGGVAAEGGVVAVGGRQNTEILGSVCQVHRAAADKIEEILNLSAGISEAQQTKYKKFKICLLGSA